MAVVLVMMMMMTKATIDHSILLSLCKPFVHEQGTFAWVCNMNLTHKIEHRKLFQQRDIIRLKS